MKKYSAKEIGWNWLAIMAGVATGFFLAAVILYVVILGFQNATNFIGVKIILILILFLPCYFAGWVTARLSTRNGIAHAILTGIFLVLALLINEDFRTDSIELEVWLLYYYILFATILGAFFCNWRRRKKAISDKTSSPDGTPWQ